VRRIDFVFSSFIIHHSAFSMTNSPVGLLLACAALVLWSLTPFFFTATGRLIGPFATNLLRLFIAFPVLLLACGLQFLWIGADGFPAARAVFLLAFSGALGLGLGDLLLYRSLFRVGPERSSLLMTLAPAVTAATAWIALEEFLSPAQLAGMTLILAGVLAAVWKRAAGASTTGPAESRWRGAANGVAAALCQGFGSVMAREAFLSDAALSPLYATTVRVGAGAISIALIARGRGVFLPGLRSLRAPRVLKPLVLGTVAGPILGMTCYIAAMKYQPAGIVTTITFMTPLLVMPLGAWYYRTRIPGGLLAGAAAAVAGVILLGWNPG
jgi:drug/metabolite transporter (DMT)-like permease